MGTILTTSTNTKTIWGTWCSKTLCFLPSRLMSLSNSLLTLDLVTKVNNKKLKSWIKWSSSWDLEDVKTPMWETIESGEFQADRRREHPSVSNCWSTPRSYSWTSRPQVWTLQLLSIWSASWINWPRQEGQSYQLSINPHHKSSPNLIRWSYLSMAMSSIMAGQGNPLIISQNLVFLFLLTLTLQITIWRSWTKKELC